MAINTPFSAAVHALAEESLRTALLPGQWKRRKHRYASDATPALNLRRSDGGAWGVVRDRFYGAAQTELFVSRLALHAGVPVAPIFVATPRRDSKTLSVIPFSNIVYTTELPLADMREYLQHTSSCLPFFLWMGQDMDRAYRNTCMNADDRNSFAEFEFENTSLANVFKTALIDPATLDDRMRDVFETSYHAAVIDGSGKLDLSDQFIQKPILRSAFTAGLERLRAVPETAVDDILDIVSHVRAVPERQRRAVKSYLGMRLFMLDIAYRTGRLDRYLVDALPDKPGIPAQKFEPFTYGFA